MTEADQRHVYDEMPYPDLTYGFTHPGRLLAIATLLGMDVAPVAGARVLELGCASGQNLLAMAYGLPGATFVGVDFSAVQIEAGRASAADLGLANVELRHADLTELDAGLGEFDVVIAHGLYSWVPEHVRDGLLALCAQVLAPQGVAMVSFNCWPGWALPAVVRDMMRYRARRARGPRELVARSRELLGFLTEAVPRRDDSAYAAFLEAYVGDLPDRELLGADWADAALLHDELDPHNRPCWFHEFAEHAAGHDLEYLADASFAESMVHDLDPAAVERAAALAEDAVDFEQYLDFVRNRMFRRAVVCRAGHAGARRVRAERALRLSAATRAAFVPPSGPEEPYRFTTSSGATFATEHPFTAAGFVHLVNVAPASVPVADLAEAASALVGRPAGPDDVSGLVVQLVRAFSADVDLVDLRADVPAPAETPSPHPVGSPVARRQAAGGPVVTSLRHDRVQLDPGCRAVLLAADGSRDLDGLVAATGLERERVGAELAWLASAALLER